jgi:heat shock protein HtpX
MISAAPTIVTIEANSAWVVILVVSLVTLPAALVFRRLIGKPGALSSSLLLGLPLGLPLIAAAFFQQGVLPEVSVLRPLDPKLFESSDWNLLHLLFMSDGQGKGLVPYVFSGAPGRWLLLLGAGFSSFMLLRRLAGTVALRRLSTRCTQAHPDHDAALLQRVAGLSREAKLKQPPVLMFLPPEVPGAFVAGIGHRPRILISSQLVDELSDDELDGILAHEIAHLAAQDVRVMVVGGLLRDLVAWNPVAHLALRRLVSEREFEADRFAASLTGKPLAVASSLLKMCELMKRHSRLRPHPGVAFIRRSGPLKRRVAHLLALADGRIATTSTSRLPYIAAACLAAVLGLQVGAQVAQQADFAIVWDAPDTHSVPLWSQDRSVQAQKVRGLKGQGSGKAQAARRVSAKTFPAGRYPVFGDGYALREKDFKPWLEAMTVWAKRNGFSPRTLAAEVNQSWRAVPVFSAPTIGPFGFYRIDLFMGRELPGPQR